MTSQIFDAVSRDGQPVRVELGANLDLVILVGAHEIRPRRGSQAFDDWLDWMAVQRRGEATTLPLDEPDRRFTEGYHR